MPVYNRPEISSPTVWRRFQRSNEQGLVRNFKIQDVTDKDRAQVLHDYLEYFSVDEIITELKNVKNEEKSLNNLKDFCEEALNARLSLICYEEMADGTCRYAGFNILKVSCKGDEENTDEDSGKIKGEGWKQVSKLLAYVAKSVDPFSRYNIDKYLGACGLFIPREYRGLKIGGEILKAREPLCKALGIKATVTTFTAIASQRLAIHCGYELLKEIPYNSPELLQQGMDFSSITSTPSIKLMGIKFSD